MSIDSIEKNFKKNMLNGTIGHAYLFSNVKYSDVKEDFNKIIKKYIFKSEVELENNPDFFLIEPEKDIIKKDKIIDLEQEIIKTSQSNSNKLYVVSECDKFNSASANSLLKTLEEPVSNVYAFLFTNNIDKVFLTIKSRCQIIYCDNFINSFEYDDDIIDKSMNLLKSIEDVGSKTIVYNNKHIYKIFNKEDLKKVLNVVEYFYKDCINLLNGIEFEYFNDKYNELIEKVVIKNNEEKIIKKIISINKNLSLLEYNLNLNSFIDKFIIELGRI